MSDITFNLARGLSGASSIVAGATFLSQTPDPTSPDAVKIDYIRQNLSHLSKPFGENSTKAETIACLKWLTALLEKPSASKTASTTKVHPKETALLERFTANLKTKLIEFNISEERGRKLYAHNYARRFEAHYLTALHNALEEKQIRSVEELRTYLREQLDAKAIQSIIDSTPNSSDHEMCYSPTLIELPNTCKSVLSRINSMFNKRHFGEEAAELTKIVRDEMKSFIEEKVKKDSRYKQYFE